MSTTPTHPVDARLDVEATAIAHLRQQLDQRGYPHADLTALRDLAIRTVNADFRAITPRPRIFQMPSPPFAIPPSLLQGFTALQLAVSNGQDLTYFQSKTRLRADFHDHLFSDWGIHHFHLGAGPDSTDPRFAARTGPVLFAFITDGHFLALGIDQHGHWADPQLLELLHQHFPAVIAHCRVDEPLLGVLRTEEEIAAFRRVGINGTVSLADGTQYRSNGGRASNGTPISAVLAANRLVASVRKIQQYIDAKLPTMRDIVASKRGVAPEELVFQVALVRKGEPRRPGFWLDETTTGYTFFLQGAPGEPHPDTNTEPGSP